MGEISTELRHSRLVITLLSTVVQVLTMLGTCRRAFSVPRTPSSVLFLVTHSNSVCCRGAFNSSQPWTSRAYRLLRPGIQRPCCFAKGRFLSCMLLRKLCVFYLLPDAFQGASLDRVETICRPAEKQIVAGCVPDN